MRKVIYLLLCLTLLLVGCGSVANDPAVNLATVPSTGVPTESATTDIQTTSKTISETTPIPEPSATPGVQTEHDEYDYELIFPSDRYPETALHILGAIEQGYTDVCTIDRDGADDNRKHSLAGIDTKDGYDRDEWPMAMCEEGGKGASVAYVESSDNRGSGSWVGNQLEDYPDGTKILFIVEKPKNLFPSQPAVTAKPTEKPAATKAPAKPTTAPTQKPSVKPTAVSAKEPAASVYYKNCTAARAAGAAPVYQGDPGYAKHLDRDGDGVGCE